MKRTLFILVIIMALFIVQNMSSSIYELWKKQDIVVNAQKQLQAEQKKNAALKKQLAQVQSPQFVEEQARDKLLLAKPNEQLVILPTGVLGEQTHQAKKASEKPHWQEWLDLFYE